MTTHIPDLHANPTEAEALGLLRRSGAMPPVVNTKDSGLAVPPPADRTDPDASPFASGSTIEERPRP